MRRLLLAALVLFLTGCDSSSDFQQVVGNVPPLQMTTLSGRVTSENGDGLAGVRVVVHERTTNAKHSGLSDSDGSFLLTLPEGVYDLGLDKEGDLSTATCFYGPVVAGRQARNFVLRSVNGRSNEKVFGKIWLRSGIPASQQRVNLVSAHALNVLKKPADVSGRTQGDGSFELSLDNGDERAMDLEIYDGNDRFDQFVDFGKLSKPCYIEMATQQSSTKNLLRAGQSELSANQVTSTPNRGVEKFDYRQYLSPGREDDIQNYDMSGGFLPVDGIAYKIYDLVKNPDSAGYLLNGPQPQKIRVAADGMWWWKYAVHIGYGYSGSYHFTDGTDDTYSLWISSGTIFPIDWHKVSYNSKSPAILHIVFGEDDPS